VSRTERQARDGSFRDAKKAFELIWTSPKLPLSTRRAIAGAVFQAGQRQGDEVFPREIIEHLLGGDPLPPVSEIAMYEKVHRFVITNGALRDQYLMIVLKVAVNNLTRHHQALAREFAKRLEQESEQN
jgi:hypothetical protein